MSEDGVRYKDVKAFVTRQFGRQTKTSVVTVGFAKIGRDGKERVYINALPVTGWDNTFLLEERPLRPSSENVGDAPEGPPFGDDLEGA